MKKRKILLVLGDVVLAYLALMVMVLIDRWGSFSFSFLEKHLAPFSLIFLFWILIFYVFGLYDLKLIRPNFTLLARIGEAILTSFIIGVILFYLFPSLGITPKTNLLVTTIAFGIITLIWRRTFHYIFASYGLEKVGFLGRNKSSERLVKEIKNNPQFGYEFVGFLKSGDLSADRQEKLIDQIKRMGINTLILAKDINKDSNLAQELYQCLSLKVNFIDLAQAYEILLQKIPVNFVNQAWFLENLTEGRKRVYDKTKRIMDFALSFFFMLITFPLWLIFALLIKLEDQGRVFYKQKRVGKEGSTFLLYKFRSMREKAEKDGAVWAQDKDNRTTKIGKVMRRLHLDELPQMINILKGEISLIGPRPERPEFVERLEKEIPHYPLRHIIKPGFTGWAQIKFRYARSLKDSHEKLQYDLFYIKNRSLLLDLGILLKTFQLFFKK